MSTRSHLITVQPRDAMGDGVEETHVVLFDQTDDQALAALQAFLDAQDAAFYYGDIIRLRRAETLAGRVLATFHTR